VAIIALVVASGVGGYLYAGMRQQSANDDIRGLREELNAKLQLLTSTTERIAQAREPMGPASPLAAISTAPLSPRISEAVLFAPACQASGGACSEASAHRLMLCGAIPTTTQVSKLELFVKGAGSPAAWEQSGTNFEQDIGGAKFTGSPSEHPQDENKKAVCVDFMHWSSEAHLARVLIEYDAIAEARPAAQTSSAETTASALAGSPTSGLSMTAPLAP
jgi:hypothetical protein